MSSTVNEFFDQIYILNLQKRSDRKITMLQKLGRLGIRAIFVDIIDNYPTQNKERFQQYLEHLIKNVEKTSLEIEEERISLKNPLTWGYLKAYYGILEDAKNRNYKRILCLSDDVIFRKDFGNNFRSSIQSIPEDWYVLFLGDSQLNDASIGLTDPEINTNVPLFDSQLTTASFALGFQSSVFDLLINRISEMNCSFNTLLFSSVVSKFPEKCFTLTPSLFLSNLSEDNIRALQNKPEEMEMWWDISFKKDLVSVIMPAYNAEKTIEKAIRSVLIQDYEELEIIVIDDASTDTTAHIAKRLAVEDTRIRLICLKENKGVGGARNEGLLATKGNIIAFQDADDVSMKNRISLQLIPIYEKGVLFTASRMLRSRCTMEELDIDNQEAMLELAESKRKKNGFGTFTYRDRAVVGMPTLVYQRSVFEQFGMYENYRYAEDLDVLERVLHSKLNKEFDDEFNGNLLLEVFEFVPNVFQVINETLIISADLNKNNLTVQYGRRKKEAAFIREEFRAKYKTGDFGAYLKLTQLEPSNFPIMQGYFHTIPLSNIGGTRNRGANQSDLEEVFNSLSWRITAPLRLVLDVLLRIKRWFQ